MRFRIGQEVVCIKKGAWQIDFGTIDNGSRDPYYNEIVTVAGCGPPQGYIMLKGFGLTSYKEDRFAPILENLDEIKETLREKVPQDIEGYRSLSVSGSGRCSFDIVMKVRAFSRELCGKSNLLDKSCNGGRTIKLIGHDF